MLINLILYPFYALSTVIMSLIAVLFAWFIAKYIDENGNLPNWLLWFQPSDNPAIGDKPWKDEQPSWSNYELAVQYLKRNPAQGFDQKLQADINDKTPCKVYGNPDTKDGVNGVSGWYLITAGNYFHLSYIIKIPFMNKCCTGGFGWRLHPLAKGYKHDTLGQFVFTPMRFFLFT